MSLVLLGEGIAEIAPENLGCIYAQHWWHHGFRVGSCLPKCHRGMSEEWHLFRFKTDGSPYLKGFEDCWFHWQRLFWCIRLPPPPMLPVLHQAIASEGKSYVWCSCHLPTRLVRVFFFYKQKAQSMNQNVCEKLLSHARLWIDLGTTNSEDPEQVYGWVSPQEVTSHGFLKRDALISKAPLSTYPSWDHTGARPTKRGGWQSHRARYNWSCLSCFGDGIVGAALEGH